MNGLNYIERDITAHLQRVMKLFPVVTVCGPRQAGKTTLIRHLYPEYEYVNLENTQTRQDFYNDPQYFVRLHKAPCIFDEIQNTPELPSMLQEIIDEKDTPGMYILTGSRQMELQQTVTQSLAGRTAFVDLLPLSIHELQQAGIRLERDEQMLRGGLPRAYTQDMPASLLYDSYLRTYIERDVRQIVNIRNMQSFELFIKLLAARVGQEVNMASMSGDIGVSATTLREWLAVLEASYIVFTLRPYYQNFGKRLTKSPKIYFTEPGLVSLLLGISTPEQMGRDPLMGHVFENMVVVEALKARLNAGKSPELYFFRDTRGFEIDLILDEQRHPRPFEIKAAMSFTPGMTKALQQFSSKVADAITPTLLYSGPPIGTVEGIQVLPYTELHSIISSPTNT